MPWQVANAAPEGKGSFCCGYSEDRCQKELAFDLNACAGSEVALGESRLQGSQASLNSDCQKQAKAIFIFNNAARCMQRRRQRFPTVRTVG
jgi:hypothetical protein